MIVPTRMLSREAAPLLASRSTEVIAWTQGEVCNWLAASGCEELIERYGSRNRFCLACEAEARHKLRDMLLRCHYWRWRRKLCRVFAST